MAAGSAFKESWVNTLRERTPPRGGSPFHHRRRPTKNGGINKPLDRPPPPSRKADEAWGWFDQLDLDLISHTSRAPFPAATPDMLAEEEQKTQAMQKKRQEVAAARAEKKAKAAQAKAEQDALRDELKTILDELTYNKLLATDKEMVDNAKAIVTETPLKIFVG